MQVTFQNFSEAEQKAFAEAFYGYFHKFHDLKYYFDCETPAPWGCPWHYNSAPAEIEGTTPEEWGIAWAQECEGEILELLALEEKENV